MNPKNEMLLQSLSGSGGESFLRGKLRRSPFPQHEMPNPLIGGLTKCNILISCSSFL